MKPRLAWHTGASGRVEILAFLPPNLNQITWSKAPVAARTQIVFTALDAARED
jgi:hypothetical protein